jgi:hypothetical protein
MKKASFVLAVLAVGLLGFLFAPSTASAQISSYNADFQIVNLAATQADITINFYNKSGTVVATVPDTIAAGGSNTYSPLPGSVPAGFDGSVVVLSDQPIAAITNVKGNGLAYGSSYSGFTAGSNVVSLPLINKAFFGINTWYNVQNTGSGATTITASYSGTTCTENATIQPGAAATFSQETNTCLPAGYNGAATITTGNSGDQVAAVVMQVFSGGLLAYNGFAAGGADLVMPLVTNNVFGILTGIQIQNQGNAASSVTVTYTANPGTGTTCTESANIPAGGAETFSINVFGAGTGNTTSNCVQGQYWIGSAVVTGNTASQPLVGIVNQTNFASGGSSSYGAFNPAEASSTVVMPLLMDAFKIWTGWSVLNVGAATTVSCTYGGTSITVNFPLASNQAKDVQNINRGTGDPAKLLPADYIGNGTCTASGGGLLLGVVNQANMNVGVIDGILTYESVNN